MRGVHIANTVVHFQGSSIFKITQHCSWLPQKMYMRHELRSNTT